VKNLPLAVPWAPEPRLAELAPQRGAPERNSPMLLEELAWWKHLRCPAEAGAG